MSESPRLTGSHVTPSPSGLLLACIIDKVLRIAYARAPEQCIDFSIRHPQAKTKALRWAQDSSRVLILSPALIEVVNLEDDKDRAVIDNGTSGFGQFEMAEFLDHQRVITVWEYGRARVWNLVNGRMQDIDNIKTLTNGPSWANRPATSNPNHVMAYLSRPAADDLLALHLDTHSPTLLPTKISTIDAQSITWSPDGRWIAVLDSAQHSPGLHIYTADGNHFRSYPLVKPDTEPVGLGIKDITWSPDSQALAVSRFDSHLELIHARTLTLIAVVEHSTMISQDNIAASQRITVWLENVGASGTRSYAPLVQPVAPPLSRLNPSEDPRRLGLASAAFSCDGKYLATMDERLLSTVWIWDVGQLRSRTVLIQHSNVKKVQWHSSIANLLLLDCGENIAYLLDVQSGEAPTSMNVSSATTLNFTFVPAHADSTTAAILAASKNSFQVLYPHGRDEGGADGDRLEEGDSIFDVLSGRYRSSSVDLSHTQRIALEADLNDGTARLDDTFVAKRTTDFRTKDPLDDSDIF